MVNKINRDSRGKIKKHNSKTAAAHKIKIGHKNNKKQISKTAAAHKIKIGHKNNSAAPKLNLKSAKMRNGAGHGVIVKALQKTSKNMPAGMNPNLKKARALGGKMAEVSEAGNKKSILEVKQKINTLESKDLNNYLLNLDAAAAATESLHKRGRRKKENKNIPRPEEAEAIITDIFNNKDIVGFLTKNVSKRSTEVLNMLVSPMTDEEIAIKLDLKINNVRRILNLMQGYGLTKYYIAKNSNGWLSFAWYINTGKIDTFFNYVKQERVNALKDDCNDYFICSSCRKKSNIVLTFDEAFDAGFKCNSCGNSYDRIEQEEVRKLIY
ncbi:MAG: hypothetical protein M1331_00225 [Candidatus Marsarchaeota archaeon]|nr:hypothetical protein [Candidatus Marsarchaeota archaeon]MCL5105812.1 hypothetical protein [Candidatus Marsarchaeota archaeon]